MKSLISISVALSAAVLAVPSSAAETITLTPGAGITSGLRANGVPVTFDQGDIDISVTGWSIDYHGVIRAGQVGVWSSGIGVVNSPTDNSHTIDNSGWTDFIVLKFSQAVELQAVSFNTGWGFADTDATIGVGVFSLSELADITDLAGLSWMALASENSWLDVYPSNSWKWFDNTRSVNPDGKSGDVWLIGASTTARKLSDGFKINNLSYNVTPTSAVPEPGTWVLMLLGLGFLGAALRSRRLSGNSPFEKCRA